MRSSRALRLLCTRSTIPRRSGRAPLKPAVIRNGYCSVCETATSRGKTAKSTTNLPILPADHRQLGIEQELFTTSVYSPGSTIFLPNGTKIFNSLTRFLRSQYEHFGFEEVITPTIYKKSLWEKSGHWENYAEDMYSVTGRGAEAAKEDRQIGEDEEYGLKPMNCPGHCLIFASKQRSYRDLPIRYADFSPLHRNEISGALSGLTRVRRFHQDDGHIFCRPSQIRQEISKTLEFVRLTYNVLGLGPYRLALSTRPADHFIGMVEEWDNAEAALKESLDASGQTWTINEGDGAFYGPKIDIILKDSDGKEHQTATIQLDFQLPKRFELEYQAPAPEVEMKGLTTDDPSLLAVQGPVTPVLIHRAVLGSVERIMALLIEHYNGHWPFWLNPRQVMIVTVSDDAAVVEYARKVRDEIQGYQPADSQSSLGGIMPLRAGLTHSHNISIDIDESARPLKKKLSEAKRKRYGIIAVVGKRNVETQHLEVDFTAIPTSRYNVGNSALLNIIARSTGTKGKESISAVGGQHIKSLDDGLGGEQPLRLSPDQLKNISISPKSLRRFLAELQTCYV
ncbi:Uncharacterized protein BP5553_02462 [Venustampulla echinocandica]|uniref:threonine--tRNA ligase n=1 Tax=Venustampulla echinocandica TaxID=2656787 RepID=A0A370U415_9HELO|nr:Uncharacterized protein BP5553_02462 [Venustampulla echinocandica]RDL42483.1 Uncharacterized protein BP5553_02462 [Venustampulla echinocandica]